MTDDAPGWTPLVPGARRPLHVVFFASTGVGNLDTTLRVGDEDPGAVRVGLVVVDRPDAPAISRARERGIPLVVRDFRAECGTVPRAGSDASEISRYAAIRERLHDEIADEIEDRERRLDRPFDLCVLAYRRVVSGRLLERFRDRMVNQHPADLAALDSGSPPARRYGGIGGLARSIREGRKATRTCTILVRSGIDDGEILCSGPWVPFGGDRSSDADVVEHENRQKRLSDAPALRFVLRAIAARDLSVDASRQHPDGRRVVLYRGIPQPYEGCTPW